MTGVRTRLQSNTLTITPRELPLHELVKTIFSGEFSLGIKGLWFCKQRSELKKKNYLVIMSCVYPLNWIQCSDWRNCALLGVDPQLITPWFALTRKSDSCQGSNCGSSRLVCKLLILDRNTWNDTAVCKLFIFYRNSWNHKTAW